MPLKRKSERRRTSNADAISITSSSDTSEASEDSAPESDGDTPLRPPGYATLNDLSDRQTTKINSGRCGMFNPLTLTPQTSRTSDLGRKRRRKRDSLRSGGKDNRKQHEEAEVIAEDVGDVADEDESLTARDARPRSQSTSGKPRKPNDRTKYTLGGLRNKIDAEKGGRMSARRKTVDTDVIELDLECEDEHSLFIPEKIQQSQPITVNDGSDSDEHLYNGMAHERAHEAKEYIQAIALLRTANKNLQQAEVELNTATAQYTSLSWKLTTIDATANVEICDIIRARDEAIRLANKQAEEDIKHVREVLPVMKESYEVRLRECDERRMMAKERVSAAQDKVAGATQKKSEMEHQGRFRLRNDVVKRQAPKRKGL